MDQLWKSFQHQGQRKIRQRGPSCAFRSLKFPFIRETGNISTHGGEYLTPILDERAWLQATEEKRRFVILSEGISKEQAFQKLILIERFSKWV